MTSLALQRCKDVSFLFPIVIHLLLGGGGCWCVDGRKSFADAMFLLPELVDLLRNKSQPEAAAEGAAAWVVGEREMRERLKKEKEARELKEKLEVSARRKFTFAELSIVSPVSPRLSR